MKTEYQGQTVAVLANAIELGKRTISNLSGTVLDGNEMEELERALAIELNNELAQRGEKC